MLNFDLTLEGSTAKIQNIYGLPSGTTYPYSFTIKITEVATSVITYIRDIPLIDFPKTVELGRGAWDIELQLLYKYTGKIFDIVPGGTGQFIVRMTLQESNISGFPLIPNPLGGIPNNYNPTASSGDPIDLIDVFGTNLGTYLLQFAQWNPYNNNDKQEFFFLAASPPVGVVYMKRPVPFTFPPAEFATSNVTVVDNTIYPRFAPFVNISPANSPRFVVKEISGCCEMKNPNNTLFAEFFDRDSAFFYGYKQKYNECDEIMIMFKSNYLYHKLQIWKNNQLLDTINCTQRTLQSPIEPLAQGVKFFETKIHWKGFGCGCYQLKIIGKDRESAVGELFATIPDSFVAISEPIQVAHFEKDFVLIEYTNNTNNYHLLYSENPAFEKLKHILRVEGWFGFEAEIEIDNEVYRTAAGKVEKLYESLAKKLNFRTGRLPNYMHEKLIIALSHDQVVINGVNVTADGKYNTKNEKNKLQLRTGEIQLTDNSFFFENEP